MDRLDIILLGATGFTGKYVVDMLVKINKNEKYADVTWGIAGRSKEKLEKILLGLRERGVDTSKIPVMESDIKNEASLKAVASRTKVLMNSTGPNTLLSEPVVRACLEAGTHYVDISAELHHMLNIYTSYNKSAEDAKVLIVPSCGYVSMPLTTGLIYLQKNFQGVLEAVECYADIDIPKKAYYPGPNKSLLHYGTWESTVHEFRNRRAYLERKNETFPEPLFEKKPEDAKRSFFFKNNGKLWYPYYGPEDDVVEMGERYLSEKIGKKPVYFKAYATMPHPLHFLIVPGMMFYYYASYLKCFRKLLWNFPKLFTLGYMSHEGPTEEMMKETKYCFTLIGKGWEKKPVGQNVCPPKKTLSVQVSGCDPGYETTAVSFVFAALTILKEYSKMPKGGVLSTEAAFYNTDIVNNMNMYGINYTVIKNENRNK